MIVLLASSNPGKVREICAICEGSELEVVTSPHYIGEVETGSTYLENARLKAASLVRLAQMPVLAEDAGLEVDGLDGRPGPRSARFAGPGATDDGNNLKLARLVAPLPEDARTARYRAVAVLLLPTGQWWSGEATFEGRIVTEPRGDSGFGYDPYFVPGGMDRTAAELSTEEKNAISHRAGALRALLHSVQGSR
ncbi:MAG TPA: RdgB/HAM1 family non-canonical purine NTP pyrophosphatase [Actinomycetota bacterium]|nr:RdgB/HAM1 family non-canonical purine NTP pyrophosphatase [Actinomycetota bacterium]